MTTVPPWEPGPYAPKYEQLADHLAVRIGAGEFPAGARLPPEKELADDYGVAYHTARHAIALLRERGLVITVHGRGNVIAARDGEGRG